MPRSQIRGTGKYRLAGAYPLGRLSGLMQNPFALSPSTKLRINCARCAESRCRTTAAVAVHPFDSIALRSGLSVSTPLREVYPERSVHPSTPHRYAQDKRKKDEPESKRVLSFVEGGSTGTVIE